jgi:hypothetical protein
MSSHEWLPERRHPHERESDPPPPADSAASGSLVLVTMHPPAPEWDAFCIDLGIDVPGHFQRGDTLYFERDPSAKGARYAVVTAHGQTMLMRWDGMTTADEVQAMAPDVRLEAVLQSVTTDYRGKPTRT